MSGKTLSKDWLYYNIDTTLEIDVYIDMFKWILTQCVILKMI